MGDRINYAPDVFDGTWTGRIKRNRVEVINEKKGLRGTAYCHPDDWFNIESGIETALARAIISKHFDLYKNYEMKISGISAITGNVIASVTNENGKQIEFEIDSDSCQKV